MKKPPGQPVSGQAGAEGVEQRLYSMLDNAVQTLYGALMLIATICTTENCPDAGKERTLGRQHLGQNLYVGGPILCGACRNEVMVGRPKES